MVLILDGNSEIVAHVLSKIGNLDLFNAFVWINSGHKSKRYFQKKNGLDSNVRNVFRVTICYSYHGEEEGIKLQQIKIKI